MTEQKIVQITRPSLCVSYRGTNLYESVYIKEQRRMYQLVSTGLKRRNKPTTIRRDQSWRLGAIWWTEHMTSLLMVPEGNALLADRLGMNGLHTPVFTQYIRSKWKVCAAAKSRKWWLGITFWGKDALKWSLAPRELWIPGHLVPEAHPVPPLPGNSQGQEMPCMLQTSGMLLRFLLSTS